MGQFPKRTQLVVAVKSGCLGRGASCADILSGGVAFLEVQSFAEEMPSFLVRLGCTGRPLAGYLPLLGQGMKVELCLGPKLLVPCVVVLCCSVFK